MPNLTEQERAMLTPEEQPASAEGLDFSDFMHLEMLVRHAREAKNPVDFAIKCGVKYKPFSFLGNENGYSFLHDILELTGRKFETLEALWDWVNIHAEGLVEGKKWLLSLPRESKT
jgi:hypothetical protein